MNIQISYPNQEKALLYLLLGLAWMVFIAYVLKYPSKPQIFNLFIQGNWVTLPRIEKIFFIFITIIQFIFINIGAYSIGRFFTVRLFFNSQEKYFESISVLGVGFGVLSIIVLLLSFMGFLYSVVLIGLLFIFILIYPIYFPVHSIYFGKVITSKISKAKITQLFVFAVFILFLIGAFLNIFTPDYGPDGYSYHLALPERYLFYNTVYFSSGEITSSYPFLVQMLYLLALGISGPELAVMINFEFGVLTLLCVYLIGKRFSVHAGVLAVLIVVSDPIFQEELSWAYADLAFSFYALLFFAWLSMGRVIPQNIIIAGIFAGFCALTKFHAAFIVVSVLSSFIVLHKEFGLVKKLKFSFWISAIATSMVLVLFARNAYYTGNPFSPFFQAFFFPPGNEYHDPFVLHQSAIFFDSMGKGKGLFEFLALPWNITFGTVEGVYRDSFAWLVTPMLLVSMVWGLALSKVRKNIFVLKLYVVIFVYLLFWFNTAQTSRFLLPILPFIALIGGIAMSEAIHRMPRLQYGIYSLLLVCILFFQLSKLDRLSFGYGFSLGAYQATEYTVNSERMGRLLRENLEPHDRVALFFENENYSFRDLHYTSYHIMEYPSLLRKISLQKDVHQIYDMFVTLGVTHILVNKKNIRVPALVPGEYSLEDFRADVKKLEHFIAEKCQLLYQDEQYDVFVIGS